MRTKKTLCILFLMITALGLASCGKSEPVITNESSQESTAKDDTNNTPTPTAAPESTIEPETTVDENNPESQNENNTEPEETVSDLSQFYGNKLPMIYEISVDNSNKRKKFLIKKTSDSYILEGSLILPEAIPQTVLVGQPKPGTTINTVSGHTYTIDKYYTTGDSLRKTVRLLDNDGGKYTIENLDSFNLYELTSTSYQMILHKKKNIEYIFNNVTIRINRKNSTKDEKKLCKNIRDILKGDEGDECTAFYIGFSKNGDFEFYSCYDVGVYDRWITDQYHKTKRIEISLK